MKCLLKVHQSVLNSDTWGSIHEKGLYSRIREKLTELGTAWCIDCEEVAITTEGSKNRKLLEVEIEIPDGVEWNEKMGFNAYEEVGVIASEANMDVEIRFTAGGSTYVFAELPAA